MPTRTSMAVAGRIRSHFREGSRSGLRKPRANARGAIARSKKLARGTSLNV
jgi:hypothetical protein